jgi:O-antigen/teichoic acid export membrane protein
MEEDIVVFIILVAFVIFIIFLVTQQNVLKAIQPHNRKMSPGEVWLQLIPLFNFVWIFIVVTRISDSIRQEFRDRQENAFLGLPNPEIMEELNRRPTYDVGMAYAVFTVCSVVPYIFGAMASLVALICWIIYWVKLAEYKNKLERLKT